MEANGLLDGTGGEIAGHRVLEGTDLEIAYDLQADDLVLRVNNKGVLVFRARLSAAAAPLGERELLNFNSFTIGDSEEGLRRMLASAGMAAAEAEPPAGVGLFRRLLGRG